VLTTRSCNGANNTRGRNNFIAFGTQKWKQLELKFAYVSMHEVAARSKASSADTHPPRLPVRIPPAAWMSVCFECCVCCQVEVSATG